MNNWFKNNALHLGVIAGFIVLCFIYFSPALQGKVLYQGDVSQAQAGQTEIMKYKAQDGKAPLWTNAMFAGMPAYQIWAQYPSNVLTHVISFLTFALPNPIYVVLMYLLGAYLLFCVLRINPWLAAAGAIAFAFTSYNFQIIEAGHSNKALAIAFFAPLLAGIILTLRGRVLWGASLTALFLALEIRANHIQMTYYLFLVLLILMGIELYHAVKQKQTAVFLKSLGFLAAAVVLAVMVNAGSLWTTYEYGQESIRGRSNLTTDKAEPKNGLTKEYAYAWSQGVAENLTFLVPNAYGGASTPQLDGDSEVAKVLTGRGVPAEQAAGFAQQLPVYWGEKAFTSGPFYFGAIICFLFVFGLFIVRNRLKWWILGATVLTLLLSFGRHWPLVSDLFFNYFPLYNKFRAVESILAVTGLLFPILAILAVNELISSKPDFKFIKSRFLYSVYIVGGLLLILLAVPGLLLSFKSSGHEQLIQQLMQVTGGDRGFADAIGNALIADRTSMARMDALRSLVFVALGAGIIWMLIKQKMGAVYACMGLLILILADMWAVDRRYLNNENFVAKADLERSIQPRQVDQLIQRDPDPNYKVLDLSAGDPFTSAMASNFHKSLGGYHAAKLKRYQEVLDKQFSQSINEDVLDMLNTKYIITSDQTGQSQKIQNRSTASGHAWFVPAITYVKNADEEMKAINSFDPRKEAFVGEEFKTVLNKYRLGLTANDNIRLLSYKPDHLTYEYTAGQDVFAVFSEVWYDKGWNAYVDGNKIPLVRANYLLRAAPLPGGNHKVELKFEPRSYYTGETISLIGSIILLGLLGFAIFREFKNKKAAAA